MYKLTTEKVCNESQIPKEWELGIILPIHKRENNEDCNNYREERGITLLNVMLKVYERRLLDNRLKKGNRHRRITEWIQNRRKSAG